MSDANVEHWKIIQQNNFSSQTETFFIIDCRLWKQLSSINRLWGAVNVDVNESWSDPDLSMFFTGSTWRRRWSHFKFNTRTIISSQNKYLRFNIDSTDWRLLKVHFSCYLFAHNFILLFNPISSRDLISEQTKENERLWASRGSKMFTSLGSDVRFSHY